MICAMSVAKGVEFDMSRNFTVAIQKDGAWYTAKCLENSVASQGKTMDEATDNLREALMLYYEDESLPVFPQTFVTTMEVAL
jgi:predicted RNase H-like HicB family nuclease